MRPIDTTDFVWRGMILGMQQAGAKYHKHEEDKIYFIISYGASIKVGNGIQRAKDAYMKTFGLRLMIKYEKATKQDAFDMVFKKIFGDVIEGQDPKLN